MVNDDNAAVGNSVSVCSMYESSLYCSDNSVFFIPSVERSDDDSIILFRYAALSVLLVPSISDVSCCTAVGSIVLLSIPAVFESPIASFGSIPLFSIIKEEDTVEEMSLSSEAMGLFSYDVVDILSCELVTSETIVGDDGNGTTLDSSVITVSTVPAVVDTEGTIGVVTGILEVEDADATLLVVCC